MAEKFMDLVAAIGDSRAAPDLRWVAALTGATVESVSRTVAELRSQTPVLREIRSRHAEGGREFYAQIRAPFELYAMTRLRRPDHVVETGVSSGVSSAFFLLALEANGGGELHSIDLPAPQAGTVLDPDESPVSLPPGRSPGWAVPSHLRDGWDLRLGPSESLLPRVVEALPSIEEFLHDSHHTPEHLTFELGTVQPKLVPGSIVMADNTEWTGDAFPRFAERLGSTVRPRGRSDLVGIRVEGRARSHGRGRTGPAAPRPSARGRTTRGG